VFDPVVVTDAIEQDLCGVVQRLGGEDPAVEFLSDVKPLRL
jgi:hypothetical protein